MQKWHLKKHRDPNFKESLIPISEFILSLLSTSCYSALTTDFMLLFTCVKMHRKKIADIAEPL